MSDFDGPNDLVRQVKAHYQRVGDLFELDPFAVHSWYAGINPGCFYPTRATAGLERWGKVAFANPRYLHFHTCGDYAPGEIAWTLLDASAEFDDSQLWKNGDFCFLQTPEIRAILDRAGISDLEIRRDIGID